MEKHWLPLSRATANRAEGVLQSDDCPLRARHWRKLISCLPTPSPPRQWELGPSFMVHVLQVEVQWGE